MESSYKRVTIPHSMRTCLGNSDERPESSRVCQTMPPPPNPPLAPTLVDAIANLINVSADNAHLLQTIAQDRAST
jgi:hypothetical protein